MNKSQWIEVNQCELMAKRNLIVNEVLVDVYPIPSDIPVAARLESTLHGSLYLRISYGRPIGTKKTRCSPKATYHFDANGRILLIKFECIGFFHEWVLFRFGYNSNSNLEMVRSVAFSLLGNPVYSSLNRNLTSDFKINERIHK